MKFILIKLAPKFLFAIIFILITTSITAQVGIGNTSPDTNSLLEIGNATTTTKGLLLPRVNLLATTNPSPLSMDVLGMIVYNKNTAGDVSPGFYYNNGTIWVRLGAAIDDDWRTTGNAGTSAATNFVGTTDNVDFMFRRNDIESGQIGVTNTSLGVNTLLNNAGTNNTALGTDALKSNTSGVENTSLGTDALKANTTGKWNTAVGYMALSLNIGNDDNTAMGAFALSKNTTAGLDNAAFGAHALQNNTTGLGNAAFGEHALYNNIGGSSNTAVGENALEENTSGIGNTVIGEDAGTRNTTGSGNVVIGQEALFSSPLGVSTGDNNVIIGRYAAQSNTSGRLNVIIGKDAMLSSTSSNFNVIMGVGAGSDPDSRADAVAITTGDQITLIGYKTQVNSSAAQNATALGFRALADCDDCLILGGVSGVNSGTSVNVGIGLNNPQYRLDVAGDINFSGDIRKNGTIHHPDYVFETYFDNNNSFNKAYSFMSLKEVDVFLKNNYHLPGVQSRDEVLENGWIVSENVRVNLEKIEELFLHTISLDKKVTELSEEKEILKNLVENQKKQLEIQSKKIDLILQKLNNK